MATFKSTGHTVFREGDPAIPDISGEKKGRRPVARGASSGRYAARGGGRRGALKRLRLRSSITGRIVSAILGRTGGR